MLPPAFAQPLPPGALPPGAVTAPPFGQPAPQARPQAATPALRPVIRGQSPDEPAPPPAPRPPVPVTIPTPEQLGVALAAAVPGSADWVSVRRRLDELHAVCFQVEALPQGGCRFLCLLPTAAPGRRQRVEAEAATEAEAASLALQKAGQCAAPHH